MDLWRRALADQRADEACLVTVIATQGSTPRHAGASMVVFADGQTLGTIGGGRVELECVREGIEVARGGGARRIRHHLVRDLAMCCGGSMELFLEPLSPCRGPLEEAQRALDSRRAVDLVTHLDPGGKTVVPAGESDTARIEGTQFVYPIRPTDRVALFGLGHVSRALGPLLAELGFEIVVCDDNETGALDHEPSWAARSIASFELSDLERVVGRLGAADYALVITRDHAIDLRVLGQLLARPELHYLGLIASRRKAERFRSQLFARGLADEGSWARVSAPIGLDIGAETPAEIAVAIAAEMISRRRPRRRQR